MNIDVRHDPSDPFRWLGEWPGFAEYRFPSLRFRISGDTVLQHLCFYIAAGWHIDPGCITFFIGFEDEGFTQDRADRVLADVPIPPGYEEVYATAQLRTASAPSLPLRWSVRQDVVTRLHKLCYDVLPTRCWGCGSNDGTLALLDCGHAHCSNCVDENVVRDLPKRCKYCQREVRAENLLDVDAFLESFRSSQVCDFTGCQLAAECRCCCDALLCSTHRREHCNTLKNHLTRSLLDCTDTAPVCFHDGAVFRTARRTLYCTHRSEYMCIYCLRDSKHIACPPHAHVEAASAEAQIRILALAVNSAVLLECLSCSIRRHESSLPQWKSQMKEVVRNMYQLQATPVAVEVTSRELLKVVLLSWSGVGSRCVETSLNDVERCQKAAAQGHEGCLAVFREAGVQLSHIVTSTGGRTLAHCAAAAGHLHCIDTLHQAGVDMNASDAKGQTIAHLIAADGHPVSSLKTQWGVELTKPDNDGRTPLHLAAQAQTGHASSWVALVSVINAQDTAGQTAAHFAAGGGHLGYLQALGDAGADFLVQDKEGSTPLHFAARGGHVRCLEFFSSKLPLTHFRAVNESRETLAHHAASGGHAACLEWLLDKEEDLTAASRNGGRTPAHLAARGGHVECLQLLLNKCGVAALNKKDDFGWSTVHHAASCGREACLDFLHTSQVDFTGKDSLGASAGHAAAQYGRAGCLEKLWRWNESCTRVPDNFGRTVVHLAAHLGHADCLHVVPDEFKILQMNERDKTMDGFTPAHLAILECHVPCLAELHRLGCTFKFPDQYRRSPAFLAAWRGHLPSLQYLVSLGVDLTSCDHRLRSPIHVLASVGHSDALDMLRAEGIRLDGRDLEGRTPAHFAASKGHASCLRVLVAAGAHDAVANDGTRPIDVAADATCEALLRVSDTPSPGTAAVVNEVLDTRPKGRDLADADTNLLANERRTEQHRDPVVDLD